MQPSSPPLSPSNISRFSSPCAIPDNLTAAVLVLVNKPDTHFYPVFHIQKDPPPDITGVNTLGKQITAFDQIIMGSDVESDLRMFFAEPKHCSLVVDSLGRIYVLNFSPCNPCLLNNATLTTNTLHPVVDRDVIHVAGKDFRVEYKPGYPMSATEATHEDTNEDTPTQLSDTIEDTVLVLSPSSSPTNDKTENSYSLPKLSTTPTPLKSGTLPHDTTDNSYASMEVNTSQPSLVARDMSTIMIVSPAEKRRVSDPPKKTIQSPIKLKRKSAPLTHTYKSMDTSNDSSTPRRSSRVRIGQRPPTPPNKRSSPRLSPGIETPRQYPSTFKHPHSTSNSARKSKSPHPLGTRKSVRFGPNLSPEEFCRDMPPSTPVKRGGTPIPKSATKAVLRRSTPYKVPIPLSAQLAKRSLRSTSFSPEDFLKTPTLSISSPKLKTPKSLQTLSPVREVQLLPNPGRPLVNDKPRLRRAFTSSVVSEMVESQSFKLSSRISTPTSLHSKQPNKLLDKGTPTGTHSRRDKVPNLASSQSFAPKTAATLLKRNSKSPEALLVQQTPKRTSVSPGNQTGQKESPKLRKQSPRLSNSPLPTHSNKPGELESQGIQRQSPRLSKSPIALQSPNPSNLSGQSESPLSRTRSPRISKSPVSESNTLTPKSKSPSPLQTPSMKSSSPLVTPPKLSPNYSQSNSKVNSPKFLSNSTPKLNSPRSSVSAPQRKPIQIPRTYSLGDSLEAPRVSKRISAPPDTLQSPMSSRPKSQIFSPQSSQQKPLGSKSPADFYKSPHANTKSPAVNTKSPAVNTKSPAVNTKSPAVNTKSPAVNTKSPAVNTKSPAVNTKSPAVNMKSPAANTKSPAVNMKFPAVTKSPAANTKSPAVNMKSPAVTRSPGVQMKSPRGRSNRSAPAISSQTPVSVKSRLSSSSTLSMTPSPPTNTSKKSPRVAGKPFATPKSPRQSPPSVPIDTSVRILRGEDAFNPKLFQTPKSKNRTSEAEANFSPSLFDTPKFRRGSKRSISAPHDTSPATLSQSKRSKSLPTSKESRRKHTAVPEDTFYPYLFRSPRTKPAYATRYPEDNFSPGMFLTPLLSSRRGVKRPLNLRGRKPTKLKRGDPRATPESSPILIQEPSPPTIQVQRPREVLKRGVNKKSTSSPVKVVLISSPKSPVTHKINPSPFLIRTSLTPDTTSPLPVRLTRNRASKHKNISPSKPINSPLKKSVNSPLKKSINSPVRRSIRTNKPVKESLIKSPILKPVIEIESSLLPLRGNRQRNASTKPIILKKEVMIERRVSSPGDYRRVLRVRNEKVSVLTSNATKSILKSPSKRKIFSPAKSKINIPISPTVSKLHTLNKTGRGRSVTVSFAAPVFPTRVMRSEKGNVRRSSRSK